MRLTRKRWMATVLMPVFFLILMTTGALASVYQGHIGKYKIVMLLDEEDRFESVYHYWGNLVGIPLKRDAEGRWCESVYTFDDDEMMFKPTACFDGRLDGENYRGKWYKTNHSRQYKFSLKKIPTPKKKEDYYNDEEFYYDLLKSEVTLHPTKKLSKKHGLTVTSRIESVTHLERSRVILKNHTVSRRINRQLDALQWNEVRQMIWCVDQNPRITLKEMQGEGSDMRVEYYRNPFLLISYSGSIDCGGAHPTNYYDQYLFDLRSGEEIALHDLFAVYTKDKEGREKTDPRFKKLLQKYRINKEGDDCYHEKDSYHSFVLNPASRNRIAVRLTGMGHATFACELDPIALIPIREMKPFALPVAYHYFPSLR